MEEIWKDINGYEGFYQVSNLGRVRSMDRYVNGNHITCDFQFMKGKIRKPVQDKLGYLKVSLRKNGSYKTYLIHRLVAEAFIPNPNNLPCVNHKDENPGNPNVDNLEWCTTDYNLKYSNVAERINKFKFRKVIQYDLNMNEIQKWNSLKEAAIFVNTAQQNISRCCKGRCETCGGYKWRYDDN